jgi:hypothetical protein
VVGVNNRHLPVPRRKAVAFEGPTTAVPCANPLPVGPVAVTPDPYAAESARFRSSYHLQLYAAVALRDSIKSVKPFAYLHLL